MLSEPRILGFFIPVGPQPSELNLTPLYQVLICKTHVLPATSILGLFFDPSRPTKSFYKANIGGMCRRLPATWQEGWEPGRIRRLQEGNGVRTPGSTVPTKKSFQQSSSAAITTTIWLAMLASMRLKSSSRGGTNVRALESVEAYVKGYDISYDSILVILDRGKDRCIKASWDMVIPARLNRDR